MNEFKKWTIAFFVLLLSGFFLITGLVYFVDPYFQYHSPIKGLNYIVDDQLTQNPGMARHFNYDAVILGSSVTVNFDTRWFNEDFGLNTIKLPYNGTYPKDYANIISQIEMSDNELKYVFWTMDVGSFSGDINETKYPINDALYDTNPFNDYSYLLNKDILFRYVIFPNLSRVKANAPINIPYTNNAGLNNSLANAYSTYQDLNYNREACLENFFYRNPDIDKDKAYRILDEGEDIFILDPDNNPDSEYSKLDENAFLDSCRANMETNILPFIEAHPNTTFIISFPPYSVLNTMIYVNNGSYDALMKEYELVISMLLEYDNVTIYYFGDETSVTYNLNIYADAIHYDQSINHWMEQEFLNPDSKYIIKKH